MGKATDAGRNMAFNMAMPTSPFSLKLNRVYQCRLNFYRTLVFDVKDVL